MVNRHIKNLILYKLVVVEGRLLREQHERKIHFFRALAKKISWSRARGKRPWNGNQFRIRKKSSFSSRRKMMIFVLSQPLSLTYACSIPFIIFSNFMPREPFNKINVCSLASRRISSIIGS